MAKSNQGLNISSLCTAIQDTCAEGPALAQAPSLPEFDMLGRSL